MMSAWSLCGVRFVLLLSAGNGGAGVLRMEETHTFAKQQMAKSHSVSLSELSSSKWGRIRINVGACRKMQSNSCDYARPARSHMFKTYTQEQIGGSFPSLRMVTVCSGLLLKPYMGEIKGNELQPASSFQWSDTPEASQASQYLPHISSHIPQVLHDKTYCMYDAR